MEKKKLGRTQAQTGASSPLANMHIVSKQLYRQCISEQYMEKIHLVSHVILRA